MCECDASQVYHLESKLQCCKLQGDSLECIKFRLLTNKVGFLLTPLHQFLTTASTVYLMAAALTAACFASSAYL